MKALAVVVVIVVAALAAVAVVVKTATAVQKKEGIVVAIIHHRHPPRTHDSSGATAAPRQSCLQIRQLSSVTSRQKSATHEFLQRLLCKGASPGDGSATRLTECDAASPSARFIIPRVTAVVYRAKISALLLIHGSANR